MIRPEAGNVDVVEAVIVIVCDCAPETVHLNREPRFPGHIGECAVLVVVIKSGVRSPARAPGQFIELISKMSCQPSLS